MAELHQLEHTVQELNLALADRASVGRWEDFGRLLRERDQLLKALPKQLQRAAFEATLEANAQILSHARSDRDATRERLDQVRQKGLVSSYYRSNGGVHPE